MEMSLRGEPGSTAHEEPLAALTSTLARRGLQAPAILLLDVAQPFHLLLEQALLLAHPILSPWSGERLLCWAALLHDGEALTEARRLLAAKVPGPESRTCSGRNARHEPPQSQR